MGSSLKLSLGLYAFPKEALITTLTHLGKLARIHDQASQDSVRLSRCWDEEGPSPMREVPSVYCSRLILLRTEVRL